MVEVNVQPFEIECKTRKGVTVRADVYLPGGDKSGKFPILLCASPVPKIPPTVCR